MRLYGRQAPLWLASRVGQRRAVSGQQHVALGEDAFDLAQPLRGDLLLQALKQQRGRARPDRRDVLGQAFAGPRLA